MNERAALESSPGIAHVSLRDALEFLSSPYTSETLVANKAASDLLLRCTIQEERASLATVLKRRREPLDPNLVMAVGTVTQAAQSVVAAMQQLTQPTAAQS